MLFNLVFMIRNKRNSPTYESGFARTSKPTATANLILYTWEDYTSFELYPDNKYVPCHHHHHHHISIVFPPPPRHHHISKVSPLPPPPHFNWFSPTSAPRFYCFPSTTTFLMFPLHYHISTVFSTPPPHFYRFSVNSTTITTTTAFLMFSHSPPPPHINCFLSTTAPPPTLPHFYCFPSNSTATTFLFFFLQLHRNYISIVFTQPAPDVYCFPSTSTQHFYCFLFIIITTITFLLFSLHRHHTNPATSFRFIPSATAPTFLLLPHHHRMYRLYRRPDRPKPVQKCSSQAKISNWNNLWSNQRGAK